MVIEDLSQFSCPMPHECNERVTLAHGGGGRLSAELIERYIRPLYARMDFCGLDAATVPLRALEKREIDMVSMAMSTDSYVVDPLFFPGGNIGKLAVCGTANDLAMVGARPRYISLSLILSEGLPLKVLESALDSISQSCKRIGLEILAGDTKVIERAHGERLFINTTGIGFVRKGVELAPHLIRSGDAILVSGDIGRHGAVIMSRREGSWADLGLESDCDHLYPKIKMLLDNRTPLHCLRDLTRGGLASALVELASRTKLDFEIENEALPILPQVSAYCEVLGLEALHLANEGCCVLFVPESSARETLGSLGPSARRIGTVLGRRSENGFVKLRYPWGAERRIVMFSGEQLPRIC